MSHQGPRTSVFTFQSAVHSDHVLQCLNEQRQQDVLCDVTVVVEDIMFRAHCSVLVSCSEYFHSRVTSVTGQNPIITLPEEVTVEGFEPLLQFAYTSKLLFTKENIHAIHSSAEFLGFRDLESACFDFLLPKYAEGKKPQEVRRGGACCQSRDPATSFISREESSQPKSFESHSSVPSEGDEHTDFPTQSPQSAQGQKRSEEEHLCLENCGPQMAPLSLELTANGVCPMLSLPCPDTDKADLPSRFCEKDILEIGDVFSCGLPCELSTPGDMNPTGLIEPAGRDVKQAVETLGAESNGNPALCPINSTVAENCSDLLEQTDDGLEQRMTGDISDSALTALSHQEGFGERSSVEREVAEHLAKGFWSDLCPSQGQPLPLDPVDQNSLAKAADFHWLKQLDLSSSVGDCPFLRDLGTGDDLTQRTNSLSQMEKSPCMSSTFNSADDSDLDTDGDTEANNRRAAEIQLPFAVDQISALSRSAFQQLLRNHHLTQDQLEFVHDVRRRSKNRVAAQRCRKRKLDGIQHLEIEIKKLKNEKERLMQEQTELEENLEEIRESLCGLYKSVSIESDQDQLQLLTKISSSPDFPSSLIKHEESQITIEMVSRSSECAPSGPPADSVQITEPEAGAQTEQTHSPQNCPVPASLLNTCVDMNSNL
ncbi:transcription regulator protein BACH1-like isoform X1 [Solea solea]|uniref:transcription regulator protein BACH1-like isoform X1 n=1 Tax=Solea solea TaxID=90069 RepID=UPI00272C4071|nr:transcription regulator protein BACH1-like isoform X1 [Solea solea]